MSNWTWQFRITGNGDTDWHTSVRPYDKAEDAAAGIAHCQAVLAMNGVILEARLVPHTKREPEPIVNGPPIIGFTGAKS